MATGGAPNRDAGVPGVNTGQGAQASVSDEPGDAPTTSAGTSAPIDGGALVDESIELYDGALLPRFDLVLPEDSFAALSAIRSSNDPAQDEYVTATFIYDKEGKNEQVAEIGVRIKGEGSFQTFEQKPALKLKFDAFVDKQRFRGLARMTLNNLFDDASFLAERLAYDVYRAAAVPAPRCNSALVYVNDEFYGVYTNIEAEDKHFLKRWFDKAGGNLYEKDGFNDLTLDNEGEFQLETNETANDRTDLLDLLATIDAATDPDTFFAELGTVIDTTEFLKLTAVEAAVNQWDMHAFTVYYVHNFRLYSDPSTGLFSWIPWGHDLAMKPFQDTVRRYVPLFELATEGSNSNRVSAGVVYQRCLDSTECKVALVQAVEDTIVVWESLDMSATAARYYEQIRPSVEADPRKRTYVNDELTMEDFDAAYDVLQATIADRVSALRAELPAR